jgi:hypothetical protein
LTDGFMRARIATKRAFGFGFFIEPTLERSAPALCQQPAGANPSGSCELVIRTISVF